MSLINTNNEIIGRWKRWFKNSPFFYKKLLDKPIEKDNKIIYTISIEEEKMKGSKQILPTYIKRVTYQCPNCRDNGVLVKSEQKFGNEFTINNPYFDCHTCNRTWSRKELIPKFEEEKKVPKRVVLEKLENNQIITWAALIKKKACDSSLFWLAENCPELDIHKFTVDQFVTWLKEKSRTSDLQWVLEKFPKQEIKEGTVHIDDADPNKVYIAKEKNNENIFKLHRNTFHFNDHTPCKSEREDDYTWLAFNNSMEYYTQVKPFSEEIKRMIDIGFNLYEFNNQKEFIEWIQQGMPQ